MSKPEFWWCVKCSGNLFPHTVRETKEMAIFARLMFLGVASKVSKLPYGESVVRIRVTEEAGRKK